MQRRRLRRQRNPSIVSVAPDGVWSRSPVSKKPPPSIAGAGSPGGGVPVQLRATAKEGFVAGRPATAGRDKVRSDQANHPPYIWGKPPASRAPVYNSSTRR